MRRNGFSSLYLIAALTGLVGICSLGVDYAHVKMVQTELQSATDSAALAAAAALASGPTAAENAAIGTAAANKADGTAVAVVRPDVEFLYWDSKTGTGTVLAGSARADANAVRVTAKRTAATGNAVPLYLAQIIGIRTCDVRAKATASTADYGYGMVGLNYIKLSGNATASYWSGREAGAPLGLRGSIGSNGDITLSGSSHISGDARPGIGRSVIGGTGRVSGSMAPLTSPLAFPPYDASGVATSNDNARIQYALTGKGDIVVKSNEHDVLPGGTYYVHHVAVSGGGSLQFTGPTTLVVWGDFTLSGSAITFDSVPGNLKVIQVPDPATGKIGKFNVSGSSALYASIYAPQSALVLSGSGAIYGAILGKSIDMTGTSDIYYDLALSGNGKLQLVQ